MRWSLLVVIALGAGCDRVFGLTFPEVQGDGGTGDGATSDAGRDAENDANTTDAMTCSYSGELNFFNANTWTPSADSNAAVLVNANGVIKFGAVPGKSVLELVAADYEDVGLVPPAGFIGLSSATLSADATQIFVTLQRTALRYALGRSTRLSSWQPVVELELRDSADAPFELGIADVTFAITSTAPRRMLLRRDDGLSELVEMTSTIWRIVHTYRAADLGLSALRDGNLAANGKTVVVIGRESIGSSFQIYRMERATVADTFAAPQVIYQSSQTTTRSPYLGDGCVLTFLGFSDVNVAI